MLSLSFLRVQATNYSNPIIIKSDAPFYNFTYPISFYFLNNTYFVSYAYYTSPFYFSGFSTYDKDWTVLDEKTHQSLPAPYQVAYCGSPTGSYDLWESVCKIASPDYPNFENLIVWCIQTSEKGDTARTYVFHAMNFSINSKTFTPITNDLNSQTYTCTINPKLFGASEVEIGATGRRESILAFVDNSGNIRRLTGYGNNSFGDNEVRTYPMPSLNALYGLQAVNYNGIYKCFGGRQTQECGQGLVYIADINAPSYSGKQGLYVNEYVSDSICKPLYSPFCNFELELTNYHYKVLVDDNVTDFNVRKEGNLWRVNYLQNNEWKTRYYDERWNLIKTETYPDFNLTSFGLFDSGIGYYYKPVFVFYGVNNSDDNIYEFEEVFECSCTDWEDQYCKLHNYMYQTRECPFDCDIEERYVYDTNCSSCEEGWICLDGDTSGYRNSDCNIIQTVECSPDICCEYTGVCQATCQAPACDVGWSCDDSHTRTYRDANCNEIQSEYCPYLCLNGYCYNQDGTSRYCNEATICLNETTRAFVNTTCQISGTVDCPSDMYCDGGDCKPRVGNNCIPLTCDEGYVFDDENCVCKPTQLDWRQKDTVEILEDILSGTKTLLASVLIPLSLIMLAFGFSSVLILLFKKMGG